MESLFISHQFQNSGHMSLEMGAALTGDIITIEVVEQFVEFVDTVNHRVYLKDCTDSELLLNIFPECGEMRDISCMVMAL